MNPQAKIVVQEIALRGHALQIEELAAELAKAYDEIPQLTANLSQKSEAVRDLTGQLTEQKQKFADDLAAIQTKYDNNLECIVDHMTLEESIFLQKLKGISSNASKRSRNDALLAIISAINDLVQEKLDQINGDTDAAAGQENASAEGKE